MTEIELFAAQLRERFAYNPGTGDLVRLTPPNKGQPAGTLNSEGYLVTRFQGKQYRVHRLAWVVVHGRWPDGEIDHINGVKTDNRLANLRDVPASLNQQNKSRAQRNSTTAYLGVSRLRDKFKAQLEVKGRSVYLGLFDTPEEASAAYLAAKAEHHPGYYRESAEQIASRL